MRTSGQSRTILFYSEAAIRVGQPNSKRRSLRSRSDAPEAPSRRTLSRPSSGSIRPECSSNLRTCSLIQVLGAGVDHLWSDPCLPKHVPIARLVDPGLTARMTEYVLLHSLALHRRLPSFETPSARTLGATCTPDPRPIPASVSWGSACLAAVAPPLWRASVSTRSVGAAQASRTFQCRPTSAPQTSMSSNAAPISSFCCSRSRAPQRT